MGIKTIDNGEKVFGEKLEGIEYIMRIGVYGIAFNRVNLLIGLEQLLLKIRNCLWQKMKMLYTIILFFILLLLVGCGSKLKLPDNPIVFDTKDNGTYMSIIWGEKEYVPYCAFDPSQVGECIGYYESNGDKVFVCKLKGQSEDEWLVDELGLDNCDEGMIFREKNTTKIPSGLSSDYEWNK